MLRARHADAGPQYAGYIFAGTSRGGVAVARSVRTPTDADGS
jgi:hypothetical protein